MLSVRNPDIRRNSQEAASLVAKTAPIKEMRFHRRLCVLSLFLFAFSFYPALCSILEKPFMPAILFCVRRARNLSLASLFTCPLFISLTRKPRAGLNTRVNPIRCKCFRARPSPSLSLFRAFLPPISFSLVVLFCREAFSS